MPGRRAKDEIATCLFVNGEHRCVQRLGRDWRYCPHHAWAVGAAFAEQLAAGAAVPRELERDHVIGVGLYAIGRVKAGAPIHLREEP